MATAPPADDKDRVAAVDENEDDPTYRFTEPDPELDFCGNDPRLYRVSAAGANLDDEEHNIEEDATATRQERDALRVEVEELRAEVTQLREQRRQAGRLALTGGRFASWFAAKVFLGLDLTGTMRTWFEALRHWLDAKAPADSMPVEETANLAAAIVRRWLRVGLWHIVLASGGVITAGILIWQGFLIRGQIQQQQAQNELIHTQVEQQAADTLIVRRAQLLDTIYTDSCREPAPDELAPIRGTRSEIVDDGESICLPTANHRVVREAVLAFVEIERGRDVVPDLSSVNLLEADLMDADLSGVNFFGADLRLARFRAVSLSGANLYSVDLRGALFFGANLRGTDLSETKLSRTELLWVDLSGANLARAHNLTPQQRALTCGDETTKLPEGLDMPDTWPCRWAVGESGSWISVPLE